MSTEERKTIARRALEEVFGKGDFDKADEFYADNFVGHASPDEIVGTEGIKRFAGMFRKGFPDLEFTIEDQLAEGDKVVTRWTARGTHKGELMGIAPTGKQMTTSGITIARFGNGKIVEGWTDRDALGMMQQIGVIPSMG